MVRSRQLTAAAAITVAGDVEQAMATREYDIITRDVLRLAFQSDCTAYDCEYVALAESLGVLFVTFDRKLRRAFPDRAIAPEAFARD